MEGSDQAEHELISTALEVEQIDANLFKSKSLWLPYRARGAFGGQVISQALVSATKCVDPVFGLHSMHCYFLLSANPAVPIIYFVERLREGRSYTTRSVKAVQNGKLIFMLMCSFHSPEPWHPNGQLAMPSNVPSPDDCELEETKFERMLGEEGWSPRIKKIMGEFAQERKRSPVAIKVAGEDIPAGDGSKLYLYWMQARNIPKYEAPFQKCILSYMSDLYFIGAAGRTVGLKRWSKGPNALSMNSTLDHSIYFYEDDFDCGDWLLYVVMSPSTGLGRGVVHGRLYTRSGKLVAVTSQEGVVRADRQPPPEAAKDGKATSKL